MDYEDTKSLESLKKQKAKAERKGNIEEESDLCNCIGEIYTRYDQFEEAIEEHERALSLCECLGNQLKIALACRFLGECYSKKGGFDKALRLHERYLSLARACANELEEQRALTTLGCTYMLQRDVALSRVAKLESSRKAEAAFLKSLEICENLKSEITENEYMDMLARLSLNLGLLYDGLGEMENSQKWLMKALGISQQYSLLEVLYLCQCNLADFLKKTTKVSDARKYIDAALVTAQKLKNKQYEVDALHSKALIDVQLEDFAMTRHSLKNAHRMTCTNREHAQKFIKLYKTVKLWEEANKKLAEVDEEDFDARILLYDKLGDCAVELGLFKKAISFYQNMLSASQSASKDESCLATIHVSIAETYKDSGQLEKAISHYQKEIECHGDSNHDQVCQSWLSIAVLQEQCGVNYKLIQKSYSEAYNAAKKANHKKLQVRALLCLSELCKMNKDGKALNKTQEKLAHIRKKYHITETDFEEDSQAAEDVESDGEDEDIVMSDLTDSEEEEKVVNSIRTCQQSGTRTQRIKVNDYGETPLHRACIDGNLDRVSKLLAEGHPLNPQDNNGWTPLHEAANNNHYEVTECLLRAGADVNNRGGKGCKGMTPLIDAASNGHIEIMELLIQYGASPSSKDDDQMTALDHLLERGKDEDFDRSTKIQYLNMVELLKERSPASRGITKNCKALAQLTTSALIPATANASSNRTKLRPVLSRTDVIHDSDSDGSDTDLLQSRVQSTKNALNRDPLETESDADLWSSNSDEPDFERNATEAYRKAICSVGRSACQSSQSSKAVTTRTANTSEKPALLPEQEVVDDWLINDIQPNTKRRKYDIDYCSTTGNSKGHRRYESASPVRKSSSGQTKSSSIKKKCSSDSDMVKITESDDSVVNVNIMSNDVEFNDPDLNENEVLVEHFACENVSTQQNTQGSSSAGGNTVCTNSLVKSRNCVMKVTVRIEDKCLIIPVIDPDRTKTFAWLAEEAASRYYKMWGAKLKLTLGKDGAHFLPDDLVSLMLSDNDKIDSFLESRDQQPPMTESYVNACKALNIITYKNVQTLLQSCEVSGKLNLSDLALRTTKFQPIIKSIQHQTCLRELILTGNRLGDTGIENLCKVLPSITNLTSLGLACNDLTVEGLKCLCAAVTSENSKALQNLRILDLGHNPLYDGCLLQIATLARNLLQLTTLCLSSCRLTTKFFQNDRINFTEALHQSSIHHFDVSYNSFGCFGVELFLMCQNPSKILCLNLTATIDDYRSSQVYRHLYSYMSQDGCSLQELELCNCHLGLENSDIFIRLPAIAKHLQKLNISDNTKLNNNVLQQLLVTSASDSSHLEDITANNCGIHSPLTVEFMDALSEKLAAAVPLRKLEFTCSMLERVDITSLTQVWKDKWEDLGIFSCDGHKVTMSILDG